MEFTFSKPFITDTALSTLLGGSENRRHSWVKRALKKGTLIRLKRGVYLVGKNAPTLIEPFEIAHQLYGSSYISFESALAHHGWIPEAVRTTTSATIKRHTTIQTPIGTFVYERAPKFQFFMGVERIATSSHIFLMAHPWKAIADYLYSRRKKWQTLNDLIEDLRLDEALVKSSDKSVLEEIAQFYDTPRVRRFASKILKELEEWM